MILNKIVLWIGLIIAIAFSRDNPFDPLIVPKDSIRPYYGETKVFDEAEIKLPSSARLIKKIEVTYQNIDGSIETQSIDVSGKIDWKMPIKISQILEKEEINKITQKDDISTESNNIYIKYDGELLKDFIIKDHDGSRIVLDFEKNMKYYKTNKIILDKPYFKSIRYGLHSNFIRIVVELDGSYVYNIKKLQNGVAINVQ